MGHPQPAFDFLMSVPMNADVDESVFIDWWAYESIDAEKGDDITDHPEVWEKQLEVPPRLKELSADDFVSLQPFSGLINLNTLAIGLGLEDVRYEPEKFGGLEYNPMEYEATVFIFSRGVIFAVGDMEKPTINALKQVFDRLENLGLDKEVSFDADMQTGRVSEFI